MAICYLQCQTDDTIKVQKLFVERHGWSPPHICFFKAAKVYGKSLQRVEDPMTQEETSIYLPEHSTSQETESLAHVQDIKMDSDVVPSLEKEITVIVKNEENEDSFNDIKVEIGDINYVRGYYATIPIIYTTRLDDMKIFQQLNKITNLTVKDITSRIISESKPKFNNQTFNVGNPVNKLKPKNLTRKIKKINKIARCEVVNNIEKNVTNYSFQCQMSNDFTEKNKTLISLCKPFSIVIERLPLEMELDTNEHYDIEPPALVSQTLQEVESLIDLKKLPREGLSYLNTYYVVIKDLASNQTEIYYLNKGVLAKHYTHPKILDISQIQRVGNIPVWEMNVCCWYKRQNIISYLRECDDVKKFISKIHGCHPGKCNCCCSSEYYNKPNNSLGEKPQASSSIGGIVIDMTSSLEDVPSTINTDDMEIMELETETSELYYQRQKQVPSKKYGYSEDWLKDLKNAKRAKSSLIDKAMQYTRIPQVSKVIKNLIPTSATLIKLTDSKTVELIELGDDNEILTYRKGTKDLQNFLNEHTLGNKCKRIFNTQICCWSARNKIMRSLFKCQPSMRCFMKPPHLCRFGKCNCCCKFQHPKKIQKFVDINLTNHSKSSDTFDNNDTLKSFDVPIVQSDCEKEQENQDKHTTINLPDVPLIDVTTNLIQSNATITGSSSNAPSQNTNISTTPASTLLPTLQPSSMISLQPIKPYTSTNTIQPQLPKDLDKTGILQGDCYSIETQCINSPTVPINSATILPTSNITVPTKPLNIVPQTVGTPPQELAVDSMITTILDRFKDVRLTINENGKVTAELATPVHTLSTAELKVLANILSHAQQQVDELGLTAGTIMYNQNSQTTQTIELKSDITDRSDEQIEVTSNTQGNTENTDTNSITDYEQKNDCKEIFFNIMNSNYKSFKSLFRTNVIDDVLPLPIIANVFSLQNDEKAPEESDVTSTTKGTWYMSPDMGETDTVKNKLHESDTNAESAIKHKSHDNQTEAPAKIKIVSPSKLGMYVSFDKFVINEPQTVSTATSSQSRVYETHPLCNLDNATPPLVKNVSNNLQTQKLVTSKPKKKTTRLPRISKSPRKPPGLKTYRKRRNNQPNIQFPLRTASDESQGDVICIPKSPVNVMQTPTGASTSSQDILQKIASAVSLTQQPAPTNTFVQEPVPVNTFTQPSVLVNTFTQPSALINAFTQQPVLLNALTRPPLVTKTFNQPSALINTFTHQPALLNSFTLQPEIINMAVEPTGAVFVEIDTDEDEEGADDLILGK